MVLAVVYGVFVHRLKKHLFVSGWQKISKYTIALKFKAHIGS